MAARALEQTLPDFSGSGEAGRRIVATGAAAELVRQNVWLKETAKAKPAPVAPIEETPAPDIEAEPPGQTPEPVNADEPVTDGETPPADASAATPLIDPAQTMQPAPEAGAEAAAPVPDIAALIGASVDQMVAGLRDDIEAGVLSVLTDILRKTLQRDALDRLKAEIDRLTTSAGSAAIHISGPRHLLDMLEPQLGSNGATPALEFEEVEGATDIIITADRATLSTRLEEFEVLVSELAQ